jgi:hypothetical protein
MITVRFPNGQAVQYNLANYVICFDRYSDLYCWKDRSNEKDKIWVAKVPNTCLIELVEACRVYDGMNQPRNDAVLKELKAIKRKLKG